MTAEAWAQVRRLCAQDGLELAPAIEDRFEAYLDLIRSWNDFARLVSKRDAQDRLWDHVADALSLTRYVRHWARGRGWLDLGSGGGFPAIPLVMAGVDVPVTLMERNARKVGFLRKAIAALGCANVAVVHGNFPDAWRGPVPGVVTARAIERPEQVWRDAADLVTGGAAALWQADDPRVWGPAMFHVEHMVDAWTETGLRRGALHAVRSAHDPAP